MRTGERALDQFPVQLPQDVAQVAEGHGAHTVQNLLVALFGHGALTGIALSGRLAEQLFKNVLQIQIAAPAKAFGEGQGDGVAIVDLGEGVSVQRVGHVTADDAGEAVQRQHGALAGAAAGDDVVRRAGVEQHRGQNAVLHVGQLGGVIGGVHAVVVHGKAHRLHHLAQRLFHNGVLGGLAVFVDECDFHGKSHPFLHTAFIIPQNLCGGKGL